MDSQGAGFAFDTTGMDFSNVYTTPQTVFSKPEDNTPGFFFGDEGIDTTTGFSFDTMSPALLSTPQMSFDMQQPLTMDNTTSGSASDWNQHLTPLMHNAMTTFPPNPTHSLNALYQQNTTLGKRSLETQELPPTKRLHETAPDFTLFPSFDTTSSWTLDSQPTPPGSIDLGLPDEAAEVCAMWFNKYNVLPNDKHIDSLSQLTGESTDAIRSWFGRLLKQGMGGSQGDSAYKSQTGLVQQQNSFWDNQYANDTFQTSPIDLFVQQPEVTATPQGLCSHEHTATVLPATTLRGSKKRCTPTDDQQLLARDPNKIYQCTRKCGKRYGRKCDWKRNEEEGYPCKSWVCSLCKSEGVENVKPCFRKYHFVQHFRNIHPDLNADEYEEASVVSSDTEFPRQCGFCRHRFTSRQDRIDHIADHFKQGKCMLDWNEEDMSDSDGSDDNNDDDDHSGDGDSDNGKPSYPPPQYDPSGDAGSKYYHGGGNGSNVGSGSGSEPPQRDFFQFQLSQLHERVSTEQQPIIDQQIKGACEGTIREAEASWELLSSARSDEGAVAGNAVSLLTTLTDLPTPAKAVISDKNVTHDSHQSVAGIAVSESIQPELQSRFSGVLTEPTGDAQEKLQEPIPTPVLLQVVTPTKQSTSRPLDEATRNTRPDASNSSTEISKQLISRQKLQTISATSNSFLSIKLLGAGGFSTVDEVVHRDTNLRVGRKTLKNRDQTAAEELRKEVNVLQKLRHPHIIRFLGAYVKGDKMSILLSPVAETTLALWLEQAAVQMPANLSSTITSMFGCLVSSVRYLHEQRPIVKHLDIKPQNILIVENGKELPHVVLTDFGVSTFDDVSDGQSVPITRQYVAPEVFNGFTRKEAADIWSLGCVFAEMASVPYSQGNAGWQAFRRLFSGPQSKNYWQDTVGIQDSLTICLEGAGTFAEQSVLRTVKTMLSAQPCERPSATALALIFSPGACCLSWSNDKEAFPGPQEELERAEKCVHKDAVSCQVQASAAASNDQTVIKQSATLTTWLSECLETHEACHEVVISGERKDLPTRLLEICPEAGSTFKVRLVDSDSIDQSVEPTEYAILSHVWSRDEALLTSDTFSRLRNGVSPRQLSEKISKACNVCHELGYRYVWVDTLCIIQDSEDDRRRECMSMASGFRNAVMTIVALDNMASDKSGDMAVSMEVADDGLTDVAAVTTPQAAYQAQSSTDRTEAQSGWDTQSWVRQERLLSRRLLHLGEQMYWECNSLKASETFPHGLSPLVWEKVHSKDIAISKTPTRKPRGTEHCLDGNKYSEVSRLPAPSRLRDCQWIKKEGDGIGDSMVAAQTTLQLGGVKLSPLTTPTKDRIVHVSRQDFPGLTATSRHNVPAENIDTVASSTATSGSLLASSGSILVREKSGRKAICASGQLDQHGRGDGKDCACERFECAKNGRRGLD